MIPACFINPGDVTLMTVPGYPVAGTHTRYYGGEVHRLPLLRERGFLPDLEGIPDDVKRRAKLLVLNYPNSPTGVVATREFYQRVVEFAHANGIVVVQDAIHAVLTFDGEPLSLLAVPGGKDVGIEIHSMSKGFDMIGWRLGWFCGHPRLVQALADVKDNSDSGQFIAIQRAAIVCDAGRHLLPLHAGAPRHRRRPAVLQCGGGEPAPHPGAVDRDGSLGRRRSTPPLLRHVRGPRRARRGRSHDGGRGTT
jgi:aspartate/methionine/tyrosine aminotransferase